MTAEPKFYTVKQVAKFLHSNIATIRRYINEGKFPGHIFCGKQYLIPKDSLAGFLHDHCPENFAEKHIS